MHMYKESYPFIVVNRLHTIANVHAVGIIVQYNCFHQR